MDVADVFARSAAHEHVDVWDFACFLCLLASVGNACARFATKVLDVVEDAYVGIGIRTCMHCADPFLLAWLGLASEQLLDASPW